MNRRQWAYPILFVLMVIGIILILWIFEPIVAVMFGLVIALLVLFDLATIWWRYYRGNTSNQIEDC